MQLNPAHSKDLSLYVSLNGDKVFVGGVLASIRLFKKIASVGITSQDSVPCYAFKLELAKSRGDGMHFGERNWLLDRLRRVMSKAC